MTTTQTKANVQSAIDNYLMWLGWYPKDFKGATEAASDFLDTEQEINLFEIELRKLAGK